MGVSWYLFMLENGSDYETLVRHKRFKEALFDLAENNSNEDVVEIVICLNNYSDDFTSNDDVPKVVESYNSVANTKITEVWTWAGRIYPSKLNYGEDE